MKKILLTSIALIFSAIIFAQQTGPAISWVETTHDFGIINESSGQQDCSFEFVNTGNEPLILQNVKPSCGCTAVDYTKTPVEPGQKGFVKASYNPKGRGTGKFNKSITVTTNEAQPYSYLRLVGESVNPDASTNQSNNAATPATAAPKNGVKVEKSNAIRTNPSNSDRSEKKLKEAPKTELQKGNKINNTNK